jgi:hypothetical protein
MKGQRIRYQQTGGFHFLTSFITMNQSLNFADQYPSPR